MIYIGYGQNGYLYLSVSFGNEIWVGEIHLGSICTQVVIEVVKVKKDIQSILMKMGLEID